MIRAACLIAVLAAGCTKEPEPGPPPAPMATESPDEVVIHVPSMVCESCPQKVTEGLAMLPWVDTESIRPDRKLQQVKFKLKDRSAFDAEALKDTISRKGFKGVRVLVGPAA